MVSERWDGHAAREEEEDKRVEDKKGDNGREGEDEDEGG